MIKEEKIKIVFFDGVCGLCNGFVDFLFSHGIQGSFHFASLQGKKAQELLPDLKLKALESVIIYDEGKIFERTEAVSKILLELKQPYKILGLILRLLPFALTNILYDLTARYRYKVFGQRETCRLPLAHEKKFFLD